MGMFDTIRSSYNFGEEFKYKEYQTKDIEDYIGGTLSEYWLDPSGKLWYLEYKDVFQFVIDNSVNNELLKYKLTPTGTNGKVVPFRLKKYIKIYPGLLNNEIQSNWSLLLHFKDGILVEYEKIKRY